MFVWFICAEGATAAHAQGRTDVVTLGNGDRITGEIMGLARGRLEFKTDDAGTLQLEWNKLVSVVATARIVEVVTTDGSRVVGTLSPSVTRAALTITMPGGTVTLPMSDVTGINPIGRNFWKKLDGSLDIGFSYTKSSGIAQLNVDSETLYRKPASEARVSASATLTKTDDDSDRDDRGTVELAYLHFPWSRWFLVGAGRFESNESLGLRLRSQIGGGAGPRLVNTNRAQVAASAGVVFNDERGIDVPSSRNAEGVFLFDASYYTYDRPKTNLDARLRYYPSLTDRGRHRVQFDGGVKREVWKDFYVSVTVYNTFDSRPPNPTADRNDVGAVLSIGWTY